MNSVRVRGVAVPLLASPDAEPPLTNSTGSVAEERQTLGVFETIQSPLTRDIESLFDHELRFGIVPATETRSQGATKDSTQFTCNEGRCALGRIYLSPPSSLSYSFAFVQWGQRLPDGEVVSKPPDFV